MTVNEMIYDTLTTKATKTPKYKKILEALGYKLNSHHFSSYYNYWEIVLFEEANFKATLVISKSSRGKKSVFASLGIVKTSDISKIDFENLIKIHNKKDRYNHYWSKSSYYESSKKIKEYKSLVQSCKSKAYDIDYHKRKIDELSKKLETELNSHKNSLKNAEEKKDYYENKLKEWKEENMKCHSKKGE